MKQKIKYLAALFVLSIAFMLTGVKAEAGTTQTGCTETSISISWTAYSGATNYRVSWLKYADYQAGNTAATQNSGNLSSTSRSYTINNLSPGCAYAIRVFAYKGSGTPVASTLYLSTLPGKVTGLRNVQSFNSFGTEYANIIWDSMHTYDGVAGYELTMTDVNGTPLYTTTTTKNGVQNQYIRQPSISYVCGLIHM